MARFEWPGGAECAVALTFDVDGETVPFVLDPGRGARRLTLISSATYGPEVGVPRIREVLREHGIRATFFIPGFTAELHPEVVEGLLADGHEIGHHGYLHERPDTLADDEEEAVLVKGIEVLERLTGRAPRGYRSPAWELKPSSPELLKRHGFRYDSSLMGNDVPYLVRTPVGTLLELPIEWLLDDYPHYATNLGGISSTQKVFEVWSQEFEGYRRYNGCYILTMHPFVSGRPSRVLLLERMIRTINDAGRVWWATLEEIAEYCLSQPVVDRLDVWSPPELEKLARGA